MLQQFQRHLLPRGDVLGQVHFAHPAGAECPDDSVIAKVFKRLVEVTRLCAGPFGGIVSW